MWGWYCCAHEPMRDGFGCDSPARGRMECASDSPLALRFRQRSPRHRKSAETAKRKLAGLRSIIFIIHAGFPPLRPNTALPAPLPEIVKNLSWNALPRIRKIPGGERERPNTRKNNSSCFVFWWKKFHRSLELRSSRQEFITRNKFYSLLSSWGNALFSKPWQVVVISVTRNGENGFTTLRRECRSQSRHQQMWPFCLIYSAGGWTTA